MHAKRGKIVNFSFANEKSLNWIKMLWCDAIFNKFMYNFAVHFYLNHLVIYWNLIWTYNEFCCTIHHIFHIMEYFAKLFLPILILSLTPLLTIDLSLNHKNFYDIYMSLNSVLMVWSSSGRIIPERQTQEKFTLQSVYSNAPIEFFLFWI